MIQLSWVIPSNKQVHIYKSKRVLYVIQGKDTIHFCKIVLGTHPVGDKMQEGDRKTPEGKFHLKSKYPHSSWTYFMWFDYQNQESYKKFKDRKKNKIISESATIGGEVGLHGVPDGMDDLIDNRVDWTWGCVSMKTEDIKKVYQLVPVGSIIMIQP